MQVVTRFFHFCPLQKDSLLVEVHSIVTNCIAENSTDVLESCGIALFYTEVKNLRYEYYYPKANQLYYISPNPHLYPSSL
jgi:hypothetical protein